MSVTTAGLRWDMDAQPLALGTFVSSSNQIASGGTEVCVMTSDPVVWSMEVKEVSTATEDMVY